MNIDIARNVFGGLASRMSRYRTYTAAGLAAIGPAAVLATRGATTPVLIVAMTAIAASTFLLPLQAQRSITFENWINLRCALLLPGRMSRCLVVAPSIFLAAAMLGWPALPGPESVILAVFAAAGTSSWAATLAFRGRGDRTTNAVLGYAATSLMMTADSVAESHVVGRSALALCAAAFLLDLAIGAISDFRGRHPRSGGVGVFFGTFNPVHRTHIDIIRAALVDRGLDVVYVHPTTVPKLHRDALESGEIEFEYRDGMRVYRKTRRADPNKNYFPTGNMFFEYEVRNELLKASVHDAGLADRVKVLELPEVYEKSGFLGLARRIRENHPGQPVHGLHGSDPGGMWVRNLFEACGGITPCPVLRKDEVSATAIRKGGVGMTTPTVENFLSAVRSSRGFAFQSGFVFEPPVSATEGNGRPRAPRPSSRVPGHVETAR